MCLINIIMSFLEALKDKKKEQPPIIKDNNKEKEKSKDLDNIYIETDYEYFDRKYGMLLFDFYYDLVDEMSDSYYNILDKEYLKNKNYSSDFFDFIFRNTYLKESGDSNFISGDGSGSEDNEYK
jgi:hypothetical protein